MLECLKDGPTTPIKRWATILADLDPGTVDDNGDPAVSAAPEVEFELQFTTQAQLDKVGDKYRNRGTDKKQMRNWRQEVFKIVVKGWKGLTPLNLKRLTDHAMEHPDQVGQLPDVIEFNAETRDWLAEHMKDGRPGAYDGTFYSVVALAQMHDEYVRVEIERRKNAPRPSSDSDSLPTLQTSVEKLDAPTATL